LIWSAASASCALSFLYEPVELMAKDEFGNISPYHTTGTFLSLHPDPNQVKIVYLIISLFLLLIVGLLWSDGSLENDLPMTRLSELFNVNHFIVSQGMSAFYLAFHSFLIVVFSYSYFFVFLFVVLTTELTHNNVCGVGIISQSTCVAIYVSF
jgi:predicted acylesterase/phospholipase RssA